MFEDQPPMSTLTPVPCTPGPCSAPSQLYWRDAVQIVSPIDKRVAAAILEELVPDPGLKYDEATVRSHPSCVDATAEAVEAYVQEVAGKLCRYPEDNRDLEQFLKVAYTPM